MFVEPAALRECADQTSVQAPRGSVIDVFDRCRQREPGDLEAAHESARLLFAPLAIDQEAQALVKRQRLDVRVLQLRLTYSS